MTQDEILKSSEYYINKVRNSVCTMLDREKAIGGLNNLQLAKRLNISTARVQQILDGGFNGKVSQLIEIALRLGYTPEIKFEHHVFSET